MALLDEKCVDICFYLLFYLLIFLLTFSHTALFVGRCAGRNVSSSRTTSICHVFGRGGGRGVTIQSPGGGVE